MSRRSEDVEKYYDQTNYYEAQIISAINILVQQGKVPTEALIGVLTDLQPYKIRNILFGNDDLRVYLTTVAESMRLGRDTGLYDEPGRRDLLKITQNGPKGRYQPLDDKEPRWGEE